MASSESTLSINPAISFPHPSRRFIYLRLTLHRFRWISTPQIVSYNIEGDNDYFPVSYYGHQKAWLAQTAEFHQQMAMSMDMPRVFEVRSMFRAENDQNSKRRLAEVCKR